MVAVCGRNLVKVEFSGEGSLREGEVFVGALLAEGVGGVEGRSWEGKERWK